MCVRGGFYVTTIAMVKLLIPCNKITVTRVGKINILQIEIKS